MGRRTVQRVDYLRNPRRYVLKHGNDDMYFQLNSGDPRTVAGIFFMRRNFKKPISKREVRAVMAAFMPLPGVTNLNQSEEVEMASFNKIIIVGYLGRDPEMRYTPQGTAVCNFSVATSEKKGEDEITTWFRVQVWGKQAENVEKYLSKGSQVYVEGRLRQDSYEGKDGQTKYTLEVNASDVRFLSAKGEKAAAAGGETERKDDEIPF